MVGGATRDAARRAMLEFIEVWYNPRRRHSALGYIELAAMVDAAMHLPPTYGQHRRRRRKREAVDHEATVCFVARKPRKARTERMMPNAPETPSA